MDGARGNTVIRTLRQRAAVTLFWVAIAMLIGATLAIMLIKGLDFYFKNY
jgi:hypothetical protein